MHGRPVVIPAPKEKPRQNMFTEIVIDGLRYEHRNDQKNETWDVYTNDELIGRLKLSGHRLTVSSLKDQGDKRQIMEPTHLPWAGRPAGTADNSQPTPTG